MIAENDAHSTHNTIFPSIAKDQLLVMNNPGGDFSNMHNPERNMTDQNTRYEETLDD